MKNTSCPTILRDGAVVIYCEGAHLKAAKWKRTSPSGRKWKTPRLYPFANWQVLEPAARAWLYRLNIALQDGECILCPADLTLQDMLG